MLDMEQFFQFFSFRGIISHPMIIIPDIPNIVIEDVSVANEIILTVRMTSPTACCSSCGAMSERVQSRYIRTLHDLPASGLPVILSVQVRRFFCSQQSCPRKIFAEPLPELCRPHAQRTVHLQKALRLLGLTVGGQAGAEVGSKQGLSGSRDTILRLVRTAEPSATVPPKKVGVDDWGATRSCICSCKNSQKEDLTWGSALSALPG